MTSAIIATSQAHKHRIQLYYVTCRGCRLVFVQRSECHLPLGHYCDNCLSLHGNPHADHGFRS